MLGWLWSSTGRLPSIVNRSSKLVVVYTGNMYKLPISHSNTALVVCLYDCTVMSCQFCTYLVDLLADKGTILVNREPV